MNIIGQNNLLKHIDYMAKFHHFPRFSIIVGREGKQITAITEHIAQQMGYFIFHLVDTKIDNIREVIHESYRIQHPIIYVFHYADDMSIPAKNALLKVTEEPPNNAYFIMLLEDLNNTLDTIRSRATVFPMEPYSRKQLVEYFNNGWESTEEYRNLVIDLSETPEDIDLLQTYGADRFYDYVYKVVQNIGEVNGANSFKIADRINLKDEQDKYDLRLFWKACIYLFHNNGLRSGGCLRFMFAVMRTSDALRKLSIRGVNKQMLFDEWIFNVREVLR